MAALLMGVVLWASNRPPLASRTSYFVGILITFYVLLFAPVSGFSINPARTTASAVFADVWTAIWIYFSAPLLGMLFSAEVYIARKAGIEFSVPSCIQTLRMMSIFMPLSGPSPGHDEKSDQLKRSFTICSATRIAFAITVSEGFTADAETKNEASTTYRLSRSCALHFVSRTLESGSIPIRHVPF